jgi:hippurate hydrolase
MRYLILTFFISLTCVIVFAQDVKNQINSDVDNSFEEYISLYKHLHQNPELSFKEVETSKRMAAELQKAGFDVTANFGGNSVVGVFKNGSGPVIMMRTDMDALPIKEKTGLPFASNKKMIGIEGDESPVMHACGHDMHMTVFIATANTLVNLKEHWKGTLVFIAQQAEEYSGGAQKMIDEGLFKNFPVPDYILAYHVSAELPVGTIGYTNGATFAGVSSVNVKFFGVGGHGALPHTTIDPVVISAKAILDYQTIVSREISPLQPAVVTVGSIHGGTKNNIIPDEVLLKLTLRAFEDDVMAKIIESIRKKSKSAAVSAGLPDELMPMVEVIDQTPPVVNDDYLLEKCIRSFKKIFDTESVIEVPPATVSEDFAYYGRSEEKIPICLTWLGSVNTEKYNTYKMQKKELPALHSSYYQPDAEPTIRIGASAMVQAIIDLMNDKP